MRMALACLCVFMTAVTSPAEQRRRYHVYRPRVDAGYIYDGALGELKYNHCAAAAWFMNALRLKR